MKIIIYLFLSSYILPAFANADLIMCERQGLRFGDGEGNDVITSQCEELFRREASEKLKVSDEKGSYSLHGYKNIIFIQDANSRLKGQNVIAGKATHLEEVEAVSLDESNKEIIVLDKSGKILFFDMVMTGNVSPKRMILHQDLESSSHIFSYQNEVIVWNSSAEELIFFDRLSDVGITQKKKSIPPKLVLTQVRGKRLVLDRGAKAFKVELSSGEFSVIYTFPE